MGFQIDGVDITSINFDGQEITELQIDGAKVWPEPTESEIIINFPTEEPASPEVGTFWYRGDNDPVWWNGTTWEGI